jgi:hypothetical protein
MGHGPNSSFYLEFRDDYFHGDKLTNSKGMSSIDGRSILMSMWKWVWLYKAQVSRRDINNMCIVGH